MRGFLIYFISIIHLAGCYPKSRMPHSELAQTVAHSYISEDGRFSDTALWVRITCREVFVKTHSLPDSFQMWHIIHDNKCPRYLYLHPFDDEPLILMRFDSMHGVKERVFFTLFHSDGRISKTILTR